jgi:molybdate transport system permease protein
MRRRTRRGPPAPIAALAGLAAVVFALPLVGILHRVEWSNLGGVLGTPGTRSALRLSLVSSSWATGISVVLGSALAWVLAKGTFRGRRLLRGLVLLPMVLPPVVGGVALLAAFSVRSPVGGWLHDALGVQLTFSTAGVVLAQTFVAMPFFVITVEGALRTIDPRFDEVAANLGASPTRSFTRVTLPLIAPSLLAGALLAWARALGEFGATITFAGNVEDRTRTLPLAVYLELERDQPAAFALSLVLIVISLSVLVLLRDRWIRRP